ncbi:MAG TPA: DUF1697 domain-containing protein [Vicinamibacterales bacterium]|nr:DUF1697 domain-containing protein [Vicinamibacterales bacterium]
MAKDAERREPHRAGTRYVALIRGINVGRAKRIAMADLRTLVEALGYADVRTLLNSGNIVFTAAAQTARAAGPRIERAMADRLEVSARVTVLSASELADAIAGNPLLTIADNPSRLLVTVLNQPADRVRLDPLTRQEWAPEALAVGRRVAYLWCADGLLASPLAVAVGRVLGDAATSRNWATMIKLAAALG